MLSDFEKYNRQNKLIQTGDRLLMAMSGGVDSMVLGHLLMQSGVHFEVAHANFQLRGADSEGDEAFVRSWCEKHNVWGHFKCFSLESADNEKSIQEEARNLRYRWFSKVLQSEKLNKLVTAHHATDNVETLFINLLRGAGAMGWAGIPAHHNGIIRPLLFAEKSAIEQFATDNQIAYREDKSNASDKYLRNKIRHHLIPVLQDIEITSVGRISENQQQLGEDIDLLNELIVLQNPTVLKDKGDRIIFTPSEIQPKTRKEEVSRWMLRPFGFIASQVAQILQCEETGKKFISDSHEILSDRGHWVIRQREAESTTNQEKVEIQIDQKTVEKPVRMQLSVHDASGFEIPMDPRFAALDFHQLSFPLILRKWRNGDRFQPLGMKQQKLVSDFLIDEKVNRFDKESVYVLESAGIIAWIVGYRLADWAKITANTQRIMLITIES